ncbi:MAG TPA: rod shape-determining protein [Pyrinomonadaceae bacterium]|nr:rod shape-determining protein [Pyrinomonadaceae bacterium]
MNPTTVLRNFFVDHLAVDLGTVNTLICVPNEGIILNEPSVVAIEKHSSEVLSVGRAAQKLLGREPRDIEVFRPIRNGSIDNFEVAQKMLKTFLKLARAGRHWRSHLVIGVPGSSTTIEQRSVREAARDARAGRVDLVDEGLAAAAGAGIDMEDEHAHLLVDIGGGTTNIALVASGGIVASRSLPVAGNTMDEAIRDLVRVKHSLQIGECTAERIKRLLGTAELTPADTSELELVGKLLTNGSGKSFVIGSEDVHEALQPALTEIINAIRSVIEEAPPEVTADIYYSEVILTGGGSLLNGMSRRLQHELNLRVMLADDPLSAVALGAGRLLEDPAKLQRAAIRQDIKVWEGSQELIVNW